MGKISTPFVHLEIDYLDHKVGNSLCQPQDGKIRKIRDALPPTTKKQVRSFLGLSGYYRDFIPNYSVIAEPLTNLTKKDRPNKVTWTDLEQKAFLTLKAKLTVKPILRLPDLTKDFVLRTDAAGVGVGAVLMHCHDEELWPVSYASRKLKRAERNYSTVERELLAVVEGVRKYYQYLYGRKFTIQTDHLPLHYLKTARNSNARIMCWALYMQQFEYSAEYIKGAENVGADYLSRVDHPSDECDDETQLGLCCVYNSLAIDQFGSDTIDERYNVTIKWHDV